MLGSSLFWAAECGSVEGVQKYLESSGKTMPDGQTALMRAASNGHIDCVRLLVEQEAKMQVVTGKFEGYTALIFAASNGQTKCVELLAEKEAKLTTPSGVTALMRAAAHGHADCVKILMKHEVTAQTETGLTALMFAARNNHEECVKLLLEEAGMQTTKAIDLKIPVPVGATALMIAAMYGHNEIVRILKPHEGEIKDSHGRDPQVYALVSASQDTLDLFSSQYTGNTSGKEEPLEGGFHHARVSPNTGNPTAEYTDLMRAAERGDLATVKKFTFEAGRSTREGVTALMLAAQHNHANCARLLLGEAGMKTRAPYGGLSMNTTALMLAAANGHIDVVRLLKTREAGMVDADGRTAYSISLANNHTHVAAELYSEVGGVSASNPISPAVPKPLEVIDCTTEVTPQHGNTTVSQPRSQLSVATPVPAPAKPLNQTNTPPKNASELTELMIAAKEGNVRVIKQHLQDQGRKDSKGWTALMHATRCGQIGAVKLLLSEATIENNVGETALDIAETTGMEGTELRLRCKRCADLLREHAFLTSMASQPHLFDRPTKDDSIPLISLLQARAQVSQIPWAIFHPVFSFSYAMSEQSGASTEFTSFQSTDRLSTLLRQMKSPEGEFPEVAKSPEEPVVVPTSRQD